MGKQVLPSDQQLPGLFLLILGPIFLTLEVQFCQDPVFLGAMGRLSRGSHWESYSGTWLAGVTFLMMTLVGIAMGWALQFLRQIGTWDKPGCNSPNKVAGTMEVGNWGTPSWLCKHMDLCRVPLNVCLAMNIYSPKQRNGDPPCGTDVPLDIIQTEFFGFSRVRDYRRSWPLCSTSICLNICGAAGAAQK